MLRRKVNYCFTDSLIFVVNFDHILKFSYTGKFLDKIGKPGRGPNEINVIDIISIIPDKKLIVAHNIKSNSESDLIYFSFNGDIVKTVPSHNIGSVKVMNDGRYIVYNPGEEVSPKYTFRLSNESGDTLSVIENHSNWEHTPEMRIGFGIFSFKPFYLYNNTYFLKDMYNDTVYSVHENTIKPGYLVHLGKYRLPDDLRPEKLGAKKIQTFIEKTSDFFVVHTFEAAGKIFLTSSNYKDEDPKYILYDKATIRGNLLVDKAGVSSGFINDLDGGTNFWPIGSINDYKVFMPINILDFQKALDKNKSTPISAKFPEKGRELKKKVTDLNITDNPIIMVVTLKK